MKLKFLSAALAVLTTITTQAEILTVDNRPGAVAMFSDFAAAHEAATDGDVILVAGSPLSYGTTNISKQLLIRGAGRIYNAAGERTLALSTELNIIFSDGSSGSILSGVVTTPRFSIPEVVIVDSLVSVASNTFNSVSPGNHNFQRCFIVGELFSANNCSYTNCVIGALALEGFGSVNGDTSGVGIQITRCTARVNRSGSAPSWIIRDSIFLDDVLPSQAVVEDSHLVTQNEEVTVFGASPGANLIGYQLNRETAVGILGDSVSDDPGAFGGELPINLSLGTGAPFIRKLNVTESVTPTSGLRIQLEAVAGDTE